MGLNMHSIVRGAIGAVNPDLTGTVQLSTGYTSLPSGKQIPSYALPIPVRIQVQALSTTDLQHVENMNQQGIMSVLYLFGNVHGINRPDSLGGDIVTFQRKNDLTRRNWLVTSVMETWPDWCRVVATLQVEVPS